jgi:hypothetical protein
VLDQARITSAGVYDRDDRLIRTLWSGRPLSSGTHQVTWDDKDDTGHPILSPVLRVRLLYHNVRYHWDGVIGNTSATFTGGQVHRAMFPPSSLATWNDQVLYAVGYNEGQSGTHGFSHDDPQRDTLPLRRPDPFTAWSLVATDGMRVYWASTGGLSRNTFVAASTLEGADFKPLSAGRELCLSYNGSSCYSAQHYFGVIDVNDGSRAAPSGIAVQAHGRVLAVAHAGLGLVNLFDKASGAFLRAIPISQSQDATNQLAFAPDGDLWVIDAGSVVRYTALDSEPRAVASIVSLSHPLAVAVHPLSDDVVLVVDGGIAQQVKAYHRDGRPLWTYGAVGGYRTDPAVNDHRLWFRFDGNRERSGVAVERDGSFWVIDTCNDRILHIARDRIRTEQLAYVPASYSVTVDPNHSDRVFANYLEYLVDQMRPLEPGGHASWKLVRNWLAGLPSQATSLEARNGGFTGLQTVVTLSNERTYALSNLPSKETALLELPATGAARFVRALPAPSLGDSPAVLYVNGDVGHAHYERGTLTVLRQTLRGFRANGDPIWESAPRILGSAPVTSSSPTNGSPSARVPLTSSAKLVILDVSVDSPDRDVHYHLGAIPLNGADWLWMASPTGPIDGHGAFQTKAIDGTVNYGASSVWSVGRQIVFGYHGEGFTDQRNGKIGEANQFMHYFDDGLFIGQFGVPTTRAAGPAAPGVAGNSFSISVVGNGSRLLLFHNDESQHGGVHRWTISNLESIGELVGSGAARGAITLH